MNVQSSPNTMVNSNFKPAHDEISARAADIWRAYGSPDGRDEEIWLEAERQLAAHNDSPAPTTQPTAPAKPVTPVQAPRVETETTGTSASVAAAAKRSTKPTPPKKR